MRNLAISFGLAIAIICAVVSINRINADNQDENVGATIAKTFVETDSEGRVTLELTMQLKDNVWVEKSKLVTKYDGENAEKTMYLFENNNWVRLSNQVIPNQEDEGVTRISLSLNNDLSFDDPDILHDIAFDKDGNLILDAVYEWDNNTKSKGVAMFEYNYSDGELSKKTTYAWNNKGWHKDIISDMLYITEKN